jgi:hypothetical protein
MTPFLHTLHLYQKPAIGTSFIRRYQVYNYRHSINAIGGFDTASCDIAIRSRDEGQQFLDQYLGNRVAFYVDNPVEPIWEGFINRMTFSAGGVEYSIGLDEMANSVWATYSTVSGSTGVTRGVSVSSTASQAIYGIKGGPIDLGLMIGGTGATIIRDTYLAERAFPKTSILPSQGGSGLLHIELLGFFHTLEWEDFRQTASASVQLGNLVDTVLGGLLNGATFFDNTDLTRTAANTNAIDQTHARSETVWDVMMKIQEFGDTTAYWVLGVSPTDFQTGTRRFYYQAANSTVVYTARQSDGLRIRNLYGQLVDPWRVQPDNGIRVSDMLIGWNGVGDNPTETYIKKIDYDANRQSCIYSGDDDLSAEGVFNLKRFNKENGKRFGAVRRLA